MGSRCAPDYFGFPIFSDRALTANALVRAAVSHAFIAADAQNEIEDGMRVSAGSSNVLGPKCRRATFEMTSRCVLVWASASNAAMSA
jgi:hypothetical protein